MQAVLSLHFISSLLTSLMVPLTSAIGQQPVQPTLVCSWQLLQQRRCGCARAVRRSWLKALQQTWHRWQLNGIAVQVGKPVPC